MRVSPSIASSDLLNIAKEIEYIDKYFDNIHIDIEDGVALLGITFGMKMAKRICDYSKSKEKTIHLEVLNPLDYLEELKNIKCDCVFIQVSHLENPLEVINKYKEAGINVGVNFNIDDIKKNDLEELLSTTNYFLVSSTDPFDPEQKYLSIMEDFCIKLAQNDNNKVWIDGCITYDTFKRLRDSKIYCAVIGRAIFSDKNLAIKNFSTIM